jgi:hypothetical protein
MDERGQTAAERRLPLPGDHLFRLNNLLRYIWAIAFPPSFLLLHLPISGLLALALSPSLSLLFLEDGPIPLLQARSERPPSLERLNDLLVSVRESEILGQKAMLVFLVVTSTTGEKEFDDLVVAVGSCEV